MSTLEDFLTNNVEGYLFGDLASMRNAVDRGNGGACGYPMLMTCFAGIEFLGALLSPDKFDPHKKGANAGYFEAFWTKHLYTTGTRKSAGPEIYQLMRHGLAHAFAAKGPISVYAGRRDDEPSHHLTYDGKTIGIDSRELADDLERAYWKSFKPLVSNRPTMKLRFKEMADKYGADAAKTMHALKKLPPPVDPPPGLRVPRAPFTSAPQGPSGPGFFTGQGASGPPFFTGAVSSSSFKPK